MTVAEPMLLVTFAEDRLLCEGCGVTFDIFGHEGGSLSSHVALCHPGQQLRVVCKICRGQALYAPHAVFEDKPQFLLHLLNTHSGTAARLSKLAGFQEQMDLRRSTNNDYVGRCQFCDRRDFANFQELREHQVQCESAGDRQWLCANCGLNFLTLQEFSRHPCSVTI